jgi:hypothetical protein
MSKETTFKGTLWREITLFDEGFVGDPVLQVKDTIDGREINAAIGKTEVARLGEALLKVSGTEGMFVTGLPKADRSSNLVAAGGRIHYLGSRTSNGVLDHAKALLSIYDELVKIEIEEEEKTKAEAERQKKKIDAANALQKRRNELAKKFSGNAFEYFGLTHTAREAIDYIIEQEADK